MAPRRLIDHPSMPAQVDGHLRFKSRFLMLNVDAQIRKRFAQIGKRGDRYGLGALAIAFT